MLMSPLQKAKALTLDVGHTLLFVSPSLGEIYAEVAANHGVDLVPEEVEDAFIAGWQFEQAQTPGLLYGTTYDDGLRFWMRVNRRMFSRGEFPDGRLRDFVAALYESFASPARWRVNPSLDPLLEACRERSVKVGLLSNWDRRLRDLITPLGWPERFDSVVISAECGLEKPDRRIFRRATDELGVGPNETIHVGDTWEDDIVGALGAGMQAAWYAVGKPPPPDSHPGLAVITDLDELIPLLA